MARFSRLTVLTTMIETGLVPVFYHGDVEVAARVVGACLDGGARCVEFTNRADQAHLVFEQLIQPRDRPPVQPAQGRLLARLRKRKRDFSGRGARGGDLQSLPR